MDIGSKIRNARIDAGYTQERAAEALGVSRQTVSNWENERSYPDIVSVIRMSEMYSISLDLLLKEEKDVKKSYMEYLEESTNTVRSRNSLTKAVMITGGLIIYALSQLVFWVFAKGPEVTVCKTVFQILLLPLSAFLLSAFAAKNGWWGKGKWALIAVSAVFFLLVPSVAFVSEGTMAARTFVWPNFLYMPVGAAVSLCGILAGLAIRRKIPKNTGR